MNESLFSSVEQSVNNSSTVWLVPINAKPQANFYQWCSFACGILLIPIALFGIIGNAITASIFCRRSMTSSINVLLVGLAVFDIWLLLTATPLFSTLAISALYKTPESSSVVGFLTLYAYPLCSMAQSASAWTMIIISVERYLAVCRPFVALVVNTVRRSFCALAFVFVVAVLYNICRFYEYSLDEKKPSYQNPKPYLRANQWYTKIYINWMYLVVMFVIPFGFLSILNSMVIAGLRKARANRRELSTQLNNEHKTALMMVIVMIIFLSCNILALILNAIETLYDELIQSYSDIFFLLTDVNNLLVEINSSVNCIVYYYFSQKFRMAFNRLFCSRISKPAMKNSLTFDLPLSTYCGDSVNEHSLLLVTANRKDTIASTVAHD